MRKTCAASSTVSTAGSRSTTWPPPHHQPTAGPEQTVWGRANYTYATRSSTGRLIGMLHNRPLCARMDRYGPQETTRTRARLLGAHPQPGLAFNLARARERQGWTLNEAAERLEPYLRRRWSKANLSAAERSIAGERIRNFDADEIVAFARCFELPIAFFFMPPPPGPVNSPCASPPPTPSSSASRSAPSSTSSTATPYRWAPSPKRMKDFLDRAGEDRLTYAQQQIAWAVKDRINAIAYTTFGDLADLQATLLDAARRLRDLETKAKRQAKKDLGVEEPKGEPEDT